MRLLYKFSTFNTLPMADGYTQFPLM